MNAERSDLRALGGLRGSRSRGIFAHERAQPADQHLDITQVPGLEWAVRVPRRKGDHRSRHVGLEQRRAVAAERAEDGVLDRDMRRPRSPLERGGERVVIVDQRVLMYQYWPGPQPQRYHMVAQAGHVAGQPDLDHDRGVELL